MDKAQKISNKAEKLEKGSPLKSLRKLKHQIKTTQHRAKQKELVEK